MVEGEGFELDEETRITFVRRDEAINLRAPILGQE